MKECLKFKDKEKIVAELAELRLLIDDNEYSLESEVYEEMTERIQGLFNMVRRGGKAMS